MPVALNKGSRRRADADNQIEWAFCKESSEVFDERSVGVVTS
jgi:hypothetical protein